MPARKVRQISIHALRVEGDFCASRDVLFLAHFYPRPPGGGRRFLEETQNSRFAISIHALRVEGDRCPKAPAHLRAAFLSTPSGWRATRGPKPHLLSVDLFLSTPSGWRATSDDRAPHQACGYFYPRPPGGGRRFFSTAFRTSRYFYPRPPGGGRRSNTPTSARKLRFLSTPSGWRATKHKPEFGVQLVISIHALRVEGDRRGRVLRSRQGISIHALRVEGDSSPEIAIIAPLHFYPRPPGGGRLPKGATPEEQAHFYPRPPGGGRPLPCLQPQWPPQISIHALRVEGDQQNLSVSPRSLYFYPRPPGGGRPGPIHHAARRLDFYPRPPGGGRLSTGLPQKQKTNFYPRPPGGGRRGILISRKRHDDFYPRPPGGGRQQKRTKFSSVFAQKGEEFASLRRGKRKICRWRFKKDKFWVLIWCEGSGKSVCALASHCG